MSEKDAVWWRHTSNWGDYMSSNGCRAVTVTQYIQERQWAV
jgi:hypothetical protein